MAKPIIKQLMAKPAAGGAFNPETDITWHSLFWAEGTDFVARGYSDTDPVGTWDNETGESDATEATNKPIYDAVNPAYNDKPTLSFSTSTNKLTTTNFSSAVSAPNSIVVISNFGTTGGYPTMFDGNDTTNRQTLLLTSAKWEIFAGIEIRSGTPDTNPHLFVCYFDGSSGNDTLDIDGTQILNSDAGGKTLDGLTIGNLITNLSNSVKGDIAFIGIYEGDITADGEWSNFTTWVEDHYGLTIA